MKVVQQYWSEGSPSLVLGSMDLSLAQISRGIGCILVILALIVVSGSTE